jgi:hypothetical protein
MKLRQDQIDYLAFRLLKQLAKEGHLRIRDTSAAEQHLTRVITDDLMVEDKLNDEVRELLAQHESRIRREGAEHHQMFKMLKAKLVKERGLIL